MRFSAASTASAGVLPSREFVFDDEGGDLRIGLRGEGVALGREFLAQGLEILDDAVVDDGEPVASVRMSVGLGRLAVRRPARVADADRAEERLGRQPRLEIAQLALGAAALDMAALQRRDAGRIVAAVFEPLQGVHDLARHRAGSKHANNSTHPVRSRPRRTPPGVKRAIPLAQLTLDEEMCSPRRVKNRK